jgi:hypothetical protein
MGRAIRLDPETRQEFEKGFMETLKQMAGTKRIMAKQVLQKRSAAISVAARICRGCLVIRSGMSTLRIGITCT